MIQKLYYFPLKLLLPYKFDKNSTTKVRKELDNKKRPWVPVKKLTSYRRITKHLVMIFPIAF